jgi:purine-nucleoside phosphorylase
MHPQSESAKLTEAATYLGPQLGEPPAVAVVLGSGLGRFADTLEDPRAFAYGSIPHMPASGVAGHPGALVLGRKGNLRVIAMQGRVHMYEGRSPAEVVFGVRLMAWLGARTLILTNAAGGIRKDLAPGDLMLIEDHINLTGHNCLTGPTDPVLGERFVDLSAAYDPALRELARDVAEGLGIELRSGVYAGLGGPSYETPAEVRMLGVLGAHAVGMSTVLETIAARQLGLRCLGISCITNLAAGLSPAPLSHQEVQETAARVERDFIALLDTLLARLTPK